MYGIYSGTYNEKHYDWVCVKMADNHRNVCVYIYIYVYMYMYIYIYTYVSAYIFNIYLIYIYIYIYVYDMFVYAYIYMANIDTCYWENDDQTCKFGVPKFETTCHNMV